MIAADVRDVIFQGDPSSWLQEHIGGMRINVGSEGFLLGDEFWNRDVLLQSYGQLVLQETQRHYVRRRGTRRVSPHNPATG